MELFLSSQPFKKGGTLIYSLKMQDLVLVVVSGKGSNRCFWTLLHCGVKLKAIIIAIKRYLWMCLRLQCNDETKERFIVASFEILPMKSGEGPQPFPVNTT